MIAVLLAGSLSMAGCASVDDARYSDIGTGAALGAAGGAGVGALVGGVGVIEGAAIGAAIGGLAGAVWSDANNDGRVDGYTYNGNYYSGQPQGYDPTLGRVATGALGGAVVGGAAGALIPGVSVLEGAIAGAVVGGLAGAIWTDQNNDGRVDGYMYNGQYYQGTPQSNPPSYSSPPMGAGERG